MHVALVVIVNSQIKFKISISFDNALHIVNLNAMLCQRYTLHFKREYLYEKVIYFVCIDWCNFIFCAKRFCLGGCSNTYVSYLNPLPYVGIGENKTNFSLNPFKGFKNCDKCKVKKVKCDECTKVKVMPCPTCRKAFADCGCNKYERVYVAPIQPRCTSCGR